LRQESDESITAIDRFIYSRLNDIQFASRYQIFQNPNAKPEEMIRFLQELGEINNVFYSFSYFNMDRFRIADSKRLSLGVQHSNSIYWSQLYEGSSVVMDVSKSESVGRVVMHFANVIKSPKGEPTGVLVGRVLIEELYNVLGNLSQDELNTKKLDVTLVNNEGLILYSNTNPSGVLKEKYGDFDLISETDSSFVETNKKLYFIAKEKGFKSYEGNQWKLILSTSKAAAFDPLKNIQNELIWVIIPVLIGSLLLALVAANFFVRPIVKLSKAASEIGKGNFNVDLSVQTKDEVGNLAKQLFKTSQVLIKQIENHKVLNKKLAIQRKKMLLQKKQLEDANVQVRDSIYYAERIQKSMLPDSSTIRKLLRDGMVIYKPKDIVRAAFY
jgi:HAMP domain-containing protein